MSGGKTLQLKMPARKPGTYKFVGEFHEKTAKVASWRNEARVTPQNLEEQCMRIAAAELGLWCVALLHQPMPSMPNPT